MTESMRPAEMSMSISYLRDAGVPESWKCIDCHVDTAPELRQRG
jgi:hypothetical protein